MTTADTAQIKALPRAEDAQALTLMNNRIIIRLRGADTNGAYSMLEYTVAPNSSGPPPHRHAFTEYFYLLDGELTFDADGEAVHARAGESVFVPGGAVHTFSNPSSQPATFQAILSPPGFEQFFEEVAARFEALGRPDLDVLLELNRRYGVEIVERGAEGSA